MAEFVSDEIRAYFTQERLNRAADIFRVDAQQGAVLGCGAWGCVYDVSGPYVIKITGDTDEGLMWERLRLMVKSGVELPAIPAIERVIRIRTVDPGLRGGVYAVLREEAGQADQELPAILGEHAARDLEDLLHDWNMAAFAFALAPDRAGQAKAKAQLQELVDEMRLLSPQLRDLADTFATLTEYEVPPVDVHGGNVGVRTNPDFGEVGQILFIDPGATRGGSDVPHEHMIQNRKPRWPEQVRERLGGEPMAAYDLEPNDSEPELARLETPHGNVVVYDMPAAVASNVVPMEAYAGFVRAIDKGMAYAVGIEGGNEWVYKESVDDAETEALAAAESLERTGSWKPTRVPWEALDYYGTVVGVVKAPDEETALELATQRFPAEGVEEVRRGSFPAYVRALSPNDAYAPEGIYEQREEGTLALPGEMVRAIGDFRQGQGDAHELYVAVTEHEWVPPGLIISAADELERQNVELNNSDLDKLVTDMKVFVADPPEEYIRREVMAANAKPTWQVVRDVTTQWDVVNSNTGVVGATTGTQWEAEEIAEDLNAGRPPRHEHYLHPNTLEAFSLDTPMRKSVAEELEERRRKAEEGDWFPASGGTEEPFYTRSGRRLQYMWQPSTGRHAYLDLGTDLLLSDEEAQEALGTFNANADGRIRIEYGAVLYRGTGWLPIIWINGEPQGSTTGAALDRDDAMRIAKDTAREEASHHVGDWNVTIKERGEVSEAELDAEFKAKYRKHRANKAGRRDPYAEYPLQLTDEEQGGLAWLADRYSSAKYLWDGWDADRNVISQYDVILAYVATAGDGGNIGTVPNAGGALNSKIWDLWQKANVAEYDELAEEFGETGEDYADAEAFLKPYMDPTHKELAEEVFGFEGNPRCPRGMKLQTLLFDRDVFTETQAKAWAKRHKKRYGKVDTTENFHRLRQVDPKKFVKGSFRTDAERWPAGIEAVYGCPKR